MSNDELIESLRRAVQSSPNDIALRKHLMDLLERSNRHEEAVNEAREVLALDPEDESAQALLDAQEVEKTSRPDSGIGSDQEESDDELVLRAMARQLGELASPKDYAPEGIRPNLRSVSDGITFADVGGMTDVKARLEAAFIAPLRHPELREAFRAELSGGSILYGPPGCGKTYLGKALAGELGARFLPVSVSDIVTMWFGESERNVRAVFETARSHSPTVLFFDELDALGFKRSQIANAVGRGVINQLLEELDGVASENAGVFVVGSTNHPWDVDVALRRPGRFDRMMLVLPPDKEARESILRANLRDRRAGEVDFSHLAEISEGLSGADLAYVCRAAAEDALLKSTREGQVVPIEESDLEAAMTQVKPSVIPWLEMAKNVVRFANRDGSYDELRTYLTSRRML